MRMNDGILIINKEAGLTSRNVDNAIGHFYGTKKVGHLGTLDPFATGLLVIGINKGTKFLPYLDDSRKTYVAALKLGIKTSTGDLTGEVVQEKDIGNLNEEKIKETLKTFLGDSEQIPPMHSAIKIDGEPLYKKAHKGIEIERKPRKIHVFDLKLISCKDNIITFEADVSRGTYIRVLGEDIASKLGTVGHLVSLERTILGPFKVEDAIKLSSLNENSIVDPSLYLTSFKSFEIEDEEDLKAVYGGVMIYVGEDLGEQIVIKKDGKALAIYKKVQDTLTYKPERGLF